MVYTLALWPLINSTRTATTDGRYVKHLTHLHMKATTTAQTIEICFEVQCYLWVDLTVTDFGPHTSSYEGHVNCTIYSDMLWGEIFLWVILTKTVSGPHYFSWLYNWYILGCDKWHSTILVIWWFLPELQWEPTRQQRELDSYISNHQWWVGHCIFWFCLFGGASNTAKWEQEKIYEQYPPRIGGINTFLSQVLNPASHISFC